MSTPTTVTYEGRQYRLVEALSIDETKRYAADLHELAQMLRPSIASSDASKGLASIRNALTNMVRSHKLLLEEEAILPKNVPGNSERLMALVTDAADSVTTLSKRLGRLANKVGVWALKIDEYVRDQESKKERDPGTQVTTPEKSRQFSHLF